MSYCRFINTLQDLRDCYDHMNDDNDDGMSDEEKRAKKGLIDLCKEIACDFEDKD